ncbi:MAG: hypothetical protein OEY21_03230 [Nitrospira sp.]|jgi:hypothetical protein|nr:hypothetical protein [Nitrospira sp.]MDH4236106.1 hypothetical protein [Nitrospira sp.]MDH4326981.1 hypothetical protein [Nitrospira sp.]MDH5253613.1 hypothetical protein [Nitrospira sp.]MDH5625094.1 hypothetical protein [Nitrospira sp.]
MKLQRIATIGLSPLQEQVVIAALAAISKRNTVRFIRTDPATADILVLDGLSLESRAAVWTYADDPARSFLLIGGDRAIRHARIRRIESPLSVRPVAALLRNLCAAQAAA